MGQSTASFFPTTPLLYFKGFVCLFSQSRQFCRQFEKDKNLAYPSTGDIPLIGWPSWDGSCWELNSKWHFTMTVRVCICWIHLVNACPLANQLFRLVNCPVHLINLPTGMPIDQQRLSPLVDRLANWPMGMPIVYLFISDTKIVDQSSYFISCTC